MKKTIIIIFLVISLFVILLITYLASTQKNTNEDDLIKLENKQQQVFDSDPCKPSIQTGAGETGYGPPNVPSVTVSEQELNNRLGRYEQFKNSKDEVFEVAFIAYLLGKYDIAEEYLNKTEKLASFKISYYERAMYFYQAELQVRKGNLSKAKEYYLKLADKYYLHIIDAKIYEQENNLEKAEHEYLMAQSVQLYEMNNYTPFEDIAQMYFKHKDYKKAKYYIEKYIACAEYELQGNGLGYTPSDTKHIDKAKELLNEIATYQ